MRRTKQREMRMIELNVTLFVMFRFHVLFGIKCDFLQTTHQLCANRADAIQSDKEDVQIQHISQSVWSRVCYFLNILNKVRMDGHSMQLKMRNDWCVLRERWREVIGEVDHSNTPLFQYARSETYRNYQIYIVCISISWCTIWLFQVPMDERS